MTQWLDCGRNGWKADIRSYGDALYRPSCHLSAARSATAIRAKAAKTANAMTERKATAHKAKITAKAKARRKRPTTSKMPIACRSLIPTLLAAFMPPLTSLLRPYVAVDATERLQLS